MKEKIQYLIEKHKPNSKDEVELVWNVLWGLVDWEKGIFRRDFFKAMEESDKVLVRVGLSIKERGYTKWMTATWRDFPSGINYEWLGKEIIKGLEEVMKNVSQKIGVELE